MDHWTSEGRLWAHKHPARTHTRTQEPTQMWTTSTLLCTVWTWHWKSIRSNQYWRLLWLHTHQLLLRRCQWHRWKSGKLSKSFQLWQPSVRKSLFESYLSSYQCFLLLIVSLQRGFLTLCSVFSRFIHAFCLCVSLLQPLPKAASIKAVKAPQPIDFLIEYHYYQQLACTMTSVKITN